MCDAALSAEVAAVKKEKKALKKRLRKLEAARDIASTVSKSSNRVFLGADSLLLNVTDAGTYDLAAQPDAGAANRPHYPDAGAPPAESAADAVAPIWVLDGLVGAAGALLLLLSWRELASSRGAA